METNHQKLYKIQRVIESFFYKSRFNIVLHNILKAQEYSDFSKKLNNAITTQVIYFAKVQTINEVIGLDKNIDKDFLDNIERLWVPIILIIAIQEFEDYYKWVANKSGQTIYNSINLDKTFFLDDYSRAESFIKQRGALISSQIDKTTIDIIARTITKGYEAGESHYNIAKMVRNSAEQIAKYRSDVIAEHEAALLIGMLTLEIFKVNGIKYKKLITSRDEKVCIVCNTDEQAGEIKEDDPFPSGQLTTPIHIGCRCFLLPVRKN